MSQDTNQDPGNSSGLHLGGSGREFEGGSQSSYGGGQEQSSRVFGSIKGGASSLASEAMERASDFAEQGKHQVTEQLDQLAKAVRQAGESLGDGEQSVPADYLRQAAERLESLSRTINETPVEEMLGTVQNFAQRNRTAIFGGAILAGIVLGRMAIAKAPSRSKGGKQMANRPDRSSGYDSGSDYYAGDAGYNPGSYAGNAGSGSGSYGATSGYGSRNFASEAGYGSERGGESDAMAGSGSSGRPKGRGRGKQGGGGGRGSGSGGSRGGEGFTGSL